MQPRRAKCLAAAGDCFVSHPSTPSCPPYVPANSSGMTHRPSPCTFLSADRPFLKLDSTFVGSVTGEGEELQTHVPCWCHGRVWKGFFQDGEDDLSPSSACPWPCCCREGEDDECSRSPRGRMGNSASFHKGRALGDENALGQCRLHHYSREE